MRRAALSALLSHWRRQPGQLLTLIAGLALATALWSAVQAINSEARRSYDAAASAMGQDRYASLAVPEGRMPLARFVTLRRAGWAVTPLLEGTVTLAGAPIDVTGFDLLSVPRDALPEGLDTGTDVTPAELFGQPGVGFAAPATAAAIAGLPGLPLILANRAIPPGRIVTDIGVAERLLDAPGQIDRLLILPGQSRGLPPLDRIAPDLVRREGQQTADLSRLTQSFHLNLTAFGLLAFGVGLFIVHGAIGLAFEQRRASFRTLRALGLAARDLQALLLAEVLLLALVAGAAGLALGYLVAGALLPDVAATLRGLYGAEVPGSLRFDPAWAAAGMAVTLIGALTAAASALTRVRRMPLLASAQPRAWATVSARALARQAVAGVVLIFLGLVALRVFSGLVAGFALLGGLLMGAALILPLLLAGLLALAAARARSPVAQWFWADTRQQLPGLSLALMALLLALSTNIGVSTMVGSFRLSFTHWIDQRLAADLYVSARDEAEAARLRAFLAPRATALLPIRSLDLPLNGTMGEVRGLSDNAAARDAWPLLSARPGAWEALNAGKAALISEQLANRGHLGLGDMIEIGPDWRLPVAGIYADYGNPVGQAAVSATALAARHPDLPGLRIGILTDDPQALSRALAEDFGLPPDHLIDQASLKAQSLAIFERTFAVTAALDGLTLAVAAFAMLTALLTLSTMRLPQLAPLWALGLTRSRLARLEAARSLALAALTFVFALPLGLILAWCLLAVVNVAAFGWRLPMHLFPAQWIWLLAAALLAALAAAALPARRLARTAPAAFLKVFADER
ncbi:FtsX-like permease family protein [Tropicimonas sp. IMCC34043]|uniref:FtsX-like permease family protein n=1 Tax=Tropicimonas sp. IMCC34043 TaxID=2248760 RepID=UPI000E252876|nr:FtsX-like permease family protein [Tropicimonas sp. IMCC34043]